MKRCLAICTIVSYLGVLSWGVAAHALNFHVADHPGMYFIVWDMFCGWNAYEDRTHIIGEGESGRFYELAPGPWGEIKPFGDLQRHHYDPFVNHSASIARNVLRHTSHEPMQRIYVIEETWAKKFNLPDEIWAERYREEKDPHSYFHLRKVLTGDGMLVSSSSSWFDFQTQASVGDNPRLWADARRGKPFFDLKPMNRSREESAGGVSLATHQMTTSTEQ